VFHHLTRGLSRVDGERNVALHAGGSAVAEWLKNKLFDYVGEYWRDGISAEQAIAEAYLAADKQLLSAKQGFMGMGKSQAHAVFKLLVCHDPGTSTGPVTDGNEDPDAGMPWCYHGPLRCSAASQR
jgi:hypothetical protein